MGRDGPAAQRLQAHFSSFLSAATRGHVVPFRKEFGVGNEMLEECERIKSQLPISRKNRPAYDVAVLCENTAGEIRIDTSLGKRIYLEKDEFYNPAPMFSICAVKQ